MRCHDAFIPCELYQVEIRSEQSLVVCVEVLKSAVMAFADSLIQCASLRLSRFNNARSLTIVVLQIQKLIGLKKPSINVTR